MSFTVRTVTQRAGGGEIVRTARYAKTVLTVGRGTDCDVQLADLAVMLEHLRIVQVGNLLRIIAAEGAPFEMDGGFVENAVVEQTEQASIAIGSQRLTLGPGEAPGDTLLAIDRSAPPADPADKDEVRVFSLAGSLPGKRTMAWLFALFILAAGLAWPIASFVRGDDHARIRPDQMWLAGSLSAAHRDLKGGCQACHAQAFVSVRDASCKGCHAAAHDHASPLRLLRAHPGLDFGDRARLAVGGVFGLAPDRCSSCHREHEGPKTVLDVPKSFCGDCHAGLKARLPDTRLLDVPDFAGHPEFRATLGAGRVSLAARPADDQGLIFSHRLHLSAAGGVPRMAQALRLGAALDCASCHRASGATFQPVRMERDCAACHSLGGVPHGNVARALAATGGRPASLAPARTRPGEIAAATPGAPRLSQAALFGTGGLCTECHRAVAGPQRIAPVREERRFFPLGGFDHARHRFGGCGDCHAARESENAGDLMLPGIQRCRDCHAQPAAPHPASGACTECHGFHAPGTAPAMRAYTARAITWEGRSGPAGTASKGRSPA